MSDFQFVCKTSEVPQGQGRSFAVAGRVIAIFHQQGEFYAIDDGCPHMAASLSTGYFDDFIVTCPLHAWRFDVRDGSWCDNPRVKTRAYELRTIDDNIELKIISEETESDEHQPLPG